MTECAGLSGGQGLISASEQCLMVMKGTLKIAETARTSVLQALVDRASLLGQCAISVLEVRFWTLPSAKLTTQLCISALGLPSDRSSLVPCLMTLKTFPVWSIVFRSLVTADAIRSIMPFSLAPKFKMNPKASRLMLLTLMPKKR